MTFADMVNKYLPHYGQLDNDNVIKKLFSIGKYSNIIQAEREVSFTF